MGTVNIAHGAFFMLGALAAFVASAFLHLDPVLSIVFSIAVCLGLGSLILPALAPSRWWVTSNTEEQSAMMVLLAGAAVIIQQVSFLFYGTYNFAVPSILPGYQQLPGPVYVTNQVTIAMAISLVTYVFLFLFLRRTKLGLGIRAYSQNKEVAESIGVAGARVSLITFAIGVTMAALAGALLASIYSASTSTGWDELITAFVIVTFGGIGSLKGSLVGSLIYGIIYSVLQFYYPSLSFIIVILVIYLLILVRPSGLFGRIVERG
jgi:branched-chain amino acid transport system permease protein